MCIFSFFVSPSKREPDACENTETAPLDFDDTTLASFHQMLLRTLLSSLDRSYEYGLPTQETLQLAYLPQAPNSQTAIDGARVALTLEGLTRLLWRNGRLQGSDGALTKAFKRGMRARGRWRISKTRKRGDNADMWLENAERSLELVIQMVERGERLCED